MAASKQTVVAFLTLSSDSSVVEFIRDIACELPEHSCKYVQLSNDDLDAFHMQRLEGYDAVVLLHSVQEGRNSVTDVSDAKYNGVLPELKRKYGVRRVAVVIYSMPSLQKSYNKDAMMLAFEDSQPTTFKCSGCVIQCNDLVLKTMFPDYRDKLISFLKKAPDSPLPAPDSIPVGDEETNQSREKTEEGSPSENEERKNDDSVILPNHSGSDIDATTSMVDEETNQSGEKTEEGSPSENEERKNDDSVVLPNHSGSDIDATIPMVDEETNRSGEKTEEGSPSENEERKNDDSEALPNHSGSRIDVTIPKGDEETN